MDFTQMALCVQKHIRMALIMILNNPYQCNFFINSLSEEVLALALHLCVFGAGLHRDSPGCLGKPQTNPVFLAEQPLLQQLCPEIKPLECPCSLGWLKGSKYLDFSNQHHPAVDHNHKQAPEGKKNEIDSFQIAPGLILCFLGVWDFHKSLESHFLGRNLKFMWKPYAGIIFDFMPKKFCQSFFGLYLVIFGGFQGFRQF